MFLFFLEEEGYLDLSPKMFYSEKLWGKNQDLKPSGDGGERTYKTKEKDANIWSKIINVLLASV